MKCLEKKTMSNKIWRCDLKSPCVKYCESKNNKHQCGINRRDKKQCKKYINTNKTKENQEEQ